jgi:hypothetical protein
VVQYGFAGAISAPALVRGDGGPRGYENDTAVCGAEGREGSLDLEGVLVK